MIRRARWTKSLAILASLLVASGGGGAGGTARAQQGPPAEAQAGISVSGGGEAKAKPNVVEITAHVAGEAELAADAIVRYRDARKRAVEALEGLKLEGLKVESGGFGVNQGVDSAQAQAMMQGNAVSTASRLRVTVSEQLKLVLPGLDKLKDEELMDTVLRVIDTGRDAGLVVGPPPPRNYMEMQNYYNSSPNKEANLVAFKLADAEALREQAYKAAMEDARKRAERLASLAGVKLGRVLSVKDASTAATDPAKETAELTSPTFKDITVKVRLAVQFAIQ